MKGSQKLGLINLMLLKLYLNSKISGIAIKCYKGGKASGVVSVKEELKQVECPKSVTQCVKGYGSGEGGEVFSHFYFFCNCEVKNLDAFFLYRVWFFQRLLL